MQLYSFSLSCNEVQAAKSRRYASSNDFITERNDKQYKYSTVTTVLQILRLVEKRLWLYT